MNFDVSAGLPETGHKATVLGDSCLSSAAGWAFWNWLGTMYFASTLKGRAKIPATRIAIAYVASLLFIVLPPLDVGVFFHDGL
jgi:hypothetical protein